MKHVNKKYKSYRSTNVSPTHMELNHNKKIPYNLAKMSPELTTGILPSNAESIARHLSALPWFLAMESEQGSFLSLRPPSWKIAVCNFRLDQKNKSETLHVHEVCRLRKLCPPPIECHPFHYLWIRPDSAKGFRKVLISMHDSVPCANCFWSRNFWLERRAHWLLIREKRKKQLRLRVLHWVGNSA